MKKILLVIFVLYMATVNNVFAESLTEQEQKLLEKYHSYVQETIQDKFNNTETPNSHRELKSIIYFEITKEGVVQNIKIQKSSRNLEFDNSGLTTITTIGKFNPLPNIEGYDKLPINFEFTGKQKFNASNFLPPDEKQSILLSEYSMIVTSQIDRSVRGALYRSHKPFSSTVGFDILPDGTITNITLLNASEDEKFNEFVKEHFSLLRFESFPKDLTQDSLFMKYTYNVVASGNATPDHDSPNISNQDLTFVPVEVLPIYQKYYKEINDFIGIKWSPRGYHKLFGTTENYARVKFRVDEQGKVHSVSIEESNKNPKFDTDVTNFLQSLQLPTPSEEIKNFDLQYIFKLKSKTRHLPIPIPIIF